MSGSSSNYGSLANSSSTAGQSTVPTWQASYIPSAQTGYSATAANQTGGIESKPSWMTGVWDADWWGRNASTGATMSNADLAPKNNNNLLNAIYNSVGSQAAQATTDTGQSEWSKKWTPIFEEWEKKHNDRKWDLINQ